MAQLKNDGEAAAPVKEPAITDYLDLPKEFTEGLDSITNEEEPEEPDSPEPQELSPDPELEETDDESEEPDEEPEEELEDEEEPEEDDKPGTVPYNRLKKVVAQRNKLKDSLAAKEAEVQQLEQQLSALRAERIQEGGPLDAVTTESELEKFERQEEELLEWALEHEDALDANGNPITVDDGKGNKRELTPKDIRKMYLSAQKNINRKIPARRKYLQQVEQADQLAKNAYPALFEKGTELNKFFNAQLDSFPAIKSYPQHKLLVALMVDGYINLTNRQKAAEDKQQKLQKLQTKKRVKPAAPIPPIGTSPSQSKRNSGRRTKKEIVEQGIARINFRDSGDEDLVAYFEAEE